MKDYRTFVIVVGCALGLCLCATIGGVKGDDLATLRTGLIGLATVQMTRSVGRAAAGGGGLEGMKDALLTRAKPDGEAPPAPAPGAGS